MVHAAAEISAQGYGQNIDEGLGSGKAVMQGDGAGLLPHVVHATGSKVVKGEDILWVQPYSNASYALFMICDGHSGSEAASFVASHFHRVLIARMPKTLPDFDDETAVKEYAELIRKCVTETFVKIDNEWSRLGQLAGTTVTVAIVTGWLLTVANAGDSMGILDTPKGMKEMVESHRIQENNNEKGRLQAAGAQIAPLGFHLQGPAKPEELGVGPLRLWPGGLCVSRSVGDLDAGSLVVPVPHIKQVILPTNGARIILASDGLWDVLPPRKVAKLIRSKLPQAAIHALIATASRDRRLADDISIIVIDFLPHENISYPSLCHPSSHAPLPEAKPGFFSSCFKPGGSASASHAELSTMELFADVDCLVAYPQIQQALTRTSQQMMSKIALHNHRTNDYTMHGAVEPRVFKAPDNPSKNLQRMRIPEEKAGATGDVAHGRDAARISNGDAVDVKANGV